MGFCLLNNVAITAAALADRGDRVLIVDYDAHHGNGTQEIFYDDPRGRCTCRSTNGRCIPGPGRLDEVGVDGGVGATCNVPLPAGATGDAVPPAVDELVAPLAARLRPTGCSCRAASTPTAPTPSPGSACQRGDYGALTTRMAQLATRPGRVVVFLEGGYDLGRRSRDGPRPQ